MHGRLSDWSPAEPYPTVMKTETTKTETTNPLPKLAVRTLDYHELSKVTGGLPPCGDGTAGTVHICHIDGTVD
jgi:hypothetical protein